MSLRRLPVVMGLLTLLTAPAAAASDPTRDDVMLNLQRCSGITDNRTWLNCFYGAAQPMRAQLGLPPAPDAQVNLVKNAPLTPPPMKSASDKDSGWLGIGNLNPFSSSDDDFSSGTTRLAAYNFGKDGLFTATLADGEVWKQSPYDDIRAHWGDQPASYIVIVTADMMGSHTMRVKGDHNYRVLRVK
ncbi:MAG: hypothetical protein ACXWLT_05660 [Rhizomicrobium sp.]